MTQEWMYLFAGATALTTAGVIGVGVVWLLKLRDTVSSALTEAAGQQVRTAQRLSESIAQLQKQQDSYTTQINVLAQAGVRLQQELSNVTNRLENAQSDHSRGNHTMH